MTTPFDWLIGGPQAQSSPGGSPYNPTFESGDVQYAGPAGSFAGNDNMIFGLNLPNPSGTPGPGLLLGSSATPFTFWIIQDQAFTTSDAGMSLGITAGETQSGSSQPGGNLTIIGGGADLGTGGGLTLQGGTSAAQNGGPTTLAGGNATSGGIPGDVYVIGGAGMAPSQGANVHLIMTEIAGISGVVRIRVNSTPLIDFYHDGSIYLYNGGGFGTSGQKLTSQGAGQPVIWS
jgi:hypothetical protein